MPRYDVEQRSLASSHVNIGKTSSLNSLPSKVRVTLLAVLNNRDSPAIGCRGRRNRLLSSGNVRPPPFDLFFMGKATIEFRASAITPSTT